MNGVIKELFKILRGVNECDIENSACSGMPINYEKKQKYICNLI